MNGLAIGSIALPLALLLVAGGLTARADDLVVNGYTYVAPSVYPAPPIMVYDPFFLVPTRTVILPRATYVAPAPVVYVEPAFVSQTVVPYNPVWNYGPVAGPTAVRERARFDRHGLEYKYQAYAPGRAAPIYSYRAESTLRGVRVRERYR